MRRFLLGVFALLLSTSFAAAECDDAKAFEVNEKPIPQKADQEIDVDVPVSHEGGSYSIYLGPNKKAERIIRSDFGLTGRLFTKLALGAPNELMISVTKQNYNVPFTEPGSFVDHEETDFYFFCDGKLLNADPASDYAKAAQEAADVFFKSPEIEAQLKAAKLTPPSWQ